MASAESIKSFADQEKAALAAQPGPGHQTLRTPFVTLRIQTSQGSFEIPLLDSTRANPSSISTQQNLEGLPQFLLLKSFSYEKSVQAGFGSNCSITVIDPQWEYIDTFVRSIRQADNLFSFTYGWRGIDDGEGIAQTVVNFRVYEIDLSLTPFQGAQVTLSGIDAGYSLAFNPAQKAFDPKRPISEVIKEVIRDATDGTVDVSVVSMPQPVGETNNRMENQTPIQYIRHLLHLAASAAGSPSFRWEIKPATSERRGQINIVTEESGLSNAPTRRYVYGREFDGRMISFSPRFLGSNLVARGGGRASGIIVDPEKKTVVRLTSTQTEDAGHNPRKQTTPLKDSAVYEVPFTRTEAQAVARKERERVDRFLYDASAVVYGDTGIEPLSNIAIIVLKGDAGQRGFNLDDASIHKFGSGIFRVDTVTHTIQAGSFTTQLEMYRNSGLEGPELNTLIVDLKTLASTLKHIAESGVQAVVEPIQQVARRFNFF